MDNDNIFDQEVLDENESSNEAVSAYDRLVGEGKKFRDNEALAKGKLESDLFIERILEENKRLRQDRDSRQNLEEIVNRLGTTNVSTPTSTNDGLESNPIQAPVAPTMNQEQIALIVKNTMMEEHTKRSQSENLKFCASEMKKAWGDTWVDKLKQVGGSLGMTEPYMDTLAKTAPKALLAIVNAQAPKPINNDVFSSPRSTVASAPSSQSNSNTGWNSYEKLRKENPRKYYSDKVQMQLHADVLSGRVVIPSK